jgi:S1-C subfamily serine protease
MRRVRLDDAPEETVSSTSQQVKATTSKLSKLSIEQSTDGEDTPVQRTIDVAPLPEKLSAKAVGPNSSNLEILLKKQKWLRRYHASLVEEDSSLQEVVNATLVFGQEEAGTAVCISEKGLLLTCSHCVAETEDELDLEKKHCLLFASGQVVRAQCIAWDAKRDLAILKVIEAQAPHDQPFPSIIIASKAPKVREPLICIGHPGSDDLEASLPGVKTNYDTLYISTGAFRGFAKDQDLQDNSEIGALKHDCWTYWGHSGAPLVTQRPQHLVGMHSSWDETTGMRRGIPLQAIQAFLQEHGVSST